MGNRKIGGLGGRVRDRLVDGEHAGELVEVGDNTVRGLTEELDDVLLVFAGSRHGTAHPSVGILGREPRARRHGAGKLVFLREDQARLVRLEDTTCSLIVIAHRCRLSDTVKDTRVAHDKRFGTARYAGNPCARRVHGKQDGRLCWFPRLRLQATCMSACVACGNGHSLVR